MLTKQISHQYPHQVHAEVEDDHLRADFEANPEKYHDGLHEHIKRYLGGEVLAKLSTPENPEDIQEWVEFLRANESATITNEQALGFIAQGGAVALDEFADRITNPDAIEIIKALYDNEEGVPPDELVDRMRSIVPDATIVSELVQSKSLIDAINFISDFYVTEYNREELFDKVIAVDQQHIFVDAIEMLAEEGKADIAFHAFLRGGDRKKLETLLDVIDEFPKDAIDANGLLNVFVGNGMAYSVLKNIDAIPTENEFNWKRLCDAVTYEGKGFELLVEKDVGLLDAAFIDYNKILEQMRVDSTFELDHRIEEFVEQAGSTAVVEAIMRLGDMYLFTRHIDLLQDADVDYNNIILLCLSTLKTCPPGLLRIAPEKIGSEKFVDMLFQHVPLNEIVSPLRIDILAEQVGAALVMERIIAGNSKLDLNTVYGMLTLLAFEPKGVYDFLKIEDMLIEYLIDNAGEMLPRIIPDAGLDITRIYVSAYSNSPSPSAANALVVRGTLTPGLDIDYALLAEQFVASGASNCTALFLKYKDCFPIETLPLDEILRDLSDENIIQRFLNGYSDQIDPHDPRFRPLYFRLITSPDVRHGALPESVFTAFTPSEIVAQWTHTPEGRSALLRYSDKLGDEYDTLELFMQMDDSELSVLQHGHIRQLIEAIGAEQLATTAMERGLHDFIEHTCTDMLNKMGNEGARRQLLEYMRDNNMAVQVANNLASFSELEVEIDYKSVVAELIEKDIGSFLYCCDSFPEESFSNDEVVLKVLEEKWLHSEIVSFLEKHPVSSQTYTQIAMIMSQTESLWYPEFIEAYPELFTEKDVQDLFDKFRSQRNFPAIYRHLNIFPETMYDVNELADESLKPPRYGHPNVDPLINNLKKLKGLDSGFVDKIIAIESDRLRGVEDAKEDIEKEMRTVAESIESFDGYTRQAFIDTVAEHGYWGGIPQEWTEGRSVDFAAYGLTTETILKSGDQALLSLYLSGETDRPVSAREEAVNLILNLFGEASTPEQSRLVQEITSGEFSEEMIILGIEDNGKKGIEALRSILDSMRTQTYNGEISEAMLETLGQSTMLQSEFAKITRQEDSTFGEHSRNSLRQKIKMMQLAETDGRLQRMPEAYTPSEVYDVQLLKTSDETATVTSDVRERYGILRDEVHAASELLTQPRGFSETVSELRSGVRAIASKIERSIQSGKVDPKAEQFQRTLLQELHQLTSSEKSSDRYPLRSLADIEKNFSTLAKHDELHPAMRKLIFAWALRKQPEWGDRLKGTKDEPSIDDIATMHSFIDQTVNDQTFRDYFNDKKSARQFKRITSVKALEGALDRNQGKGIAKEATKLQIVPSRGLMLELSGHIGDACWADKYNSINEKMPNMSAILFRQNPGEKSERLVGSALLIETKNSRTGEDVLLLRGVNPIENYINKVSAESFYDTVTDYARSVANKRGMKPAIVIDDHSGGSGTNRPALFAHLRDQINKLVKVPVENSTTEFNGYDVTRDSYAI